MQVGCDAGRTDVKDGNHQRRNIEENAGGISEQVEWMDRTQARDLLNECTKTSERVKLLQILQSKVSSNRSSNRGYDRKTLLLAEINSGLTFPQSKHSLFNSSFNIS